MQKVITVRASQKDLDMKLNEITKLGWEVVSVTKGSEMGRIGFSYKWTVVLNIPDNTNSDIIQKRLSLISNDLNGKSAASTVALVVGIFVVIGLVILFTYLFLKR
ncbi:MAG: hypothetical protein ACI4QI_03435 [Candidatus Coproplasma sp.]